MRVSPVLRLTLSFFLVLQTTARAGAHELESNSEAGEIHTQELDMSEWTEMDRLQIDLAVSEALIREWQKQLAELQKRQDVTFYELGDSLYTATLAVGAVAIAGKFVKVTREPFRESLRQLDKVIMANGDKGLATRVKTAAPLTGKLVLKGAPHAVASWAFLTATATACVYFVHSIPVGAERIVGSHSIAKLRDVLEKELLKIHRLQDQMEKLASSSGQ